MAIKLYCAPRFSKAADIRLFRALRSESEQDSGLLYKETGYTPHFDAVLVDGVAQADFVVLTQAVRKVTPQIYEHIRLIAEFAKAHNKKLLVFCGGDLSHAVQINVENTVVFKILYKHLRRKNEVTGAPFVQDLGKDNLPPPRHKGKKPVVSFCGYAGFPNLKTRLRYIVKNAALDFAAFITRNPTYHVYKRGIYFRRKTMSVLRASHRVEVNFIVRDSFSGNAFTAHVDPAAARQEFIKSMIDADFILAPKGDGNYSNRFYEALSLGRIPILIDTEIVLPLENMIDYSKCVLRIPHTDMGQIGTIVADFYNNLSDEEFTAMQCTARDVFEKYLRYDSFFNTALPILKEKGIEAIV